jgi:hypothetical protein
VSLAGKGAWTGDPVPLACLPTHGPWSAIPRPVNPIPPVILPRTRLTMGAITLPARLPPPHCLSRRSPARRAVHTSVNGAESPSFHLASRRSQLLASPREEKTTRIWSPCTQACGFGKREKRTKSRRQMRREQSGISLSLSLLDWALVFLVDSLIQSVASCSNGELNVFGK